ncbi:hypothetical protein [Vibrio cholerae]|uniref:hypothetical protein n=1 Tax=Vibrio cholerae TaxID=666 RepID=UPI001159B6B9|nr:hypothetical protein [Vibrio cholerae]TQO64874.1 hypothetical protein FLM08_11530 [Vibrio cholerae]TQQ11497.1 hypothetical protein FLL69_16855 [Vibrio cholerae]TQQ57826.1 hypothetical protein FLL63_15515 [Vibrio cholerae]
MYIKTDKNWLYLGAVVDCILRCIIANGHRITKALVLDAYVSDKLLKSVPNGKSVVISNSHQVTP